MKSVVKFFYCLIYSKFRAKMPYMQKGSSEELLELLPHRWIRTHPEALCKDFRTKAK